MCARSSIRSRLAMNNLFLRLILYMGARDYMLEMYQVVAC